MRRAILAACAAVAWLWGKGKPRRVATGREAASIPDPMDGVQWDPWTREVRESVEPALEFHHYGLMGGSSVSIPQAPQWRTYSSSDGTQPPYIDNPVLVRMRDAYRGQTLGGT